MFSTGKYLHEIIDTTDCKRHERDRGNPCWWVYPDRSGPINAAICGNRIRKAGHNGKISTSSLTKTSNK